MGTLSGDLCRVGLREGVEEQLGEVRRSLEVCEQERLELEVKYGMGHSEFQRRLEAGALGDEFGYELEMDAMRWDDLIAEKQHWLRQLRLVKELLQSEEAIAELARVSKHL